MYYKIVSLAGMIGLCWATIAIAEGPQQSPQELLKSFSQTWREADWQQKAGSQSAGYMRRSDDEGWQARMRAMQALVQHGGDAIPLLLETLRTGDMPQRILAAQTLGYLGSNVPTEPLVAALKSDTDSAVRLYLVDALGMLGKGDAVDWIEYLKGEPNRDVKRHVGYVQERAGQPLDARVVDRLKQWDGGKMNKAALDQPAPDFALSSMQGGAVSLSDFRGKKAVVLVFIYGDT